ncbi:MAG: four helix bundle protein [Bacteroidales bacterium]|nr:four helix bundle protein [Bacteroidales bacterium]
MESAKESFNDEFRKRTKENALAIIKLYSLMRNKDELRIMGKQMIRSGCSVAANFRASCRARSQAEHYSKLCIVVEECDETLFWLEMIEATGFIDPQTLKPIKEETFSILQVLSKTRKNLKH